MPSSPFTYVAGATEVALVLTGSVLLWRLVLSPKARASKDEPRLSTWDANIFQIMLLIWSVAAGGLCVQVVLMQFMKALPPTPGLQQITAGAGFQLGMLAGCLLFIRYSDGGKSFSRPAGPFLKSGIASFLIALPIVFVVGFVWSGLLQLCGIPIERQELIELFRKTDSPFVLGVMVFLAVIVAPLTEELIFRAGLFRFLRTRTPRWVALVLPSLIFAALHGNLASLTQLMALGIVFSIAYERSGNIAVPILAHSLFNLNTMILLAAGIDA